ncbi:hypothetical protein PUNSTDRAFT_84925 [Punctularia strigosozonata HHB-11173 SS5]|uniref:uncharacterized protein n=1 Tax=Punctularia strigosozonata (strain HHB-11173) TaxID=741275 RepID=UPI000441824D|nr:uncharacterized protein PUNSTDRAFT_84925 [Punctularia strigosozonata HHB-11173 SS5]EIN10676.1 hypothetical protein PUNSTDRAFT_84925 [Punctularia strigosozonata HHB-11173 SS5]
MAKDNFPATPHLYESRLQTVIRNIRMSGEQPSKSDYNFVLEQFAAVGHHLGAVRVLQEMKRSGVDPTIRTYTLCLQAIAHRLTLPARKTVVERLQKETSDLCLQILHEMWNRRMPLSSVTLDLAFRIFKETMDDEGLDWLLKMGYGIDLAWPDRLPLEVMSSLPRTSFPPNVPAPSSSTPDFFTSNKAMLQPFSTSALNTTIDFLGRSGNVSRLVQAFEVLTKPLPPEYARFVSRSFDEEDDDWGEGSSAPPEPPQSRPLPSAEPNTTTYSFLIRHLAQARHTVLARHYLWENLVLSEDVDRRLRGDIIRGIPYSEIVAPRLSITYQPVLSVMHLANRDKDLPLLRQCLKVCHRAAKRKRRNLEFYRRVRDEEEAKRASISESQDAEGGETTPLEVPAHSPRPTEPPSSSSSPQDLSLSEPIKTFDLDLHIRILDKELSRLAELEERLEFVIARTTQRIKERLGRRVWKGKDIWMPRVAAPGRSQWEAIEGLTGVREVVERRAITKAEWKQRVGFKTDIGAQWTRKLRRNRADKPGRGQGQRTFRKYGA